CNDGPKIIQSSNQQPSPNTTGSSGIFDNDATSPTSKATHSQSGNDVHIVEVLEVLPTEKYVYLNVKEIGQDKKEDDLFWIASLKQEVQIGEKYTYKGGLLKTNFESKEHNRIFDKVYLVSNLIPLNGAKQAAVKKPKSTAPTSNQNVDVEGSITIADLIKNADKYEGQTVQLSGTCKKINPNIMNRNWIHLIDGTMDDYDLVITSNTMVPEGHFVTLKGTLNRNVDFGAGYTYDIIIENAELVR
ncbi:MAG: hypothetical protein HKO66_01360, partial [Saprospiraceae bacterium]|nr:hypothetical protein [Saprospiraceae bacterium]